MLRGMMLAPGLLAATLAAGCSTAPITVGSTSTALLPHPSSGIVAASPAAPPLPVIPASEQRLADDGPPCAIRLADVRDVRPNPNDLGMMIGRAVHASDSAGWFRSAVDALKQDSRLRFVDADADVRLVLRVELVKAYIMVQNTQKSSNVVIRAVYSRDGKDFDTQIARGTDEGANWVNGEDEAQGSLNRALAAAVAQLDSNIGAHCRAAQ